MHINKLIAPALLALSTVAEAQTPEEMRELQDGFITYISDVNPIEELSGAKFLGERTVWLGIYGSNHTPYFAIALEACQKMDGIFDQSIINETKVVVTNFRGRDVRALARCEMVNLSYWED